MASGQQLTVILIVITGLSVTSYLFYQQSQKKPNKLFENENSENNETQIVEDSLDNTTETLIETEKEITIRILLNPRFPQCFAESTTYTTLSEILYELYLSSNSCVGVKCNSNQTAHRKNVTSKETTGLVVTYLAVGILLISLVAAFLDVVKEKKETKVIKKPELTRRCSLADFTVLRHNRRESMLRRDSIREVTLKRESTVEDTETKRVPLGTIGRKSSRPRIRT